MAALDPDIAGVLLLLLLLAGASNEASATARRMVACPTDTLVTAAEMRWEEGLNRIAKFMREGSHSWVLQRRRKRKLEK